MPAPQFSIRALLFLTVIASLTLAASRVIVEVLHRNDWQTWLYVLAVACILGPPGMSLLGFAIGQESKFPWTGTAIGTLLGLVFLFLLLQGSQSLH